MQPLSRLVSFLVRGKGDRFSGPRTATGTLGRTTTYTCELRKDLLRPMGLVLTADLRAVHALRRRIGDVSGTVRGRLSRFPGALRSVPNVKPIYATKVVTRVNSVRHFSGRGTITGFANLA